MMKAHSQIQRRLLFLEGVIVLAILGVEARLAYLQVLKHSEYHEMAYHQQFTTQHTDAVRGLIEDRSGDLMAMNIDLYDVCAHPLLITDKAHTASILSQALGMSYDEVLEKISGDKPFVWLAREVPYEKSQSVENLKLDGIEADREEHRFYPDREMGAHVLGFTGIDNQGLDGLEEYYDSSLAGKSGLVMAERDAKGRPVVGDDKQVQSSKDGLNVVTTIDETLQHIAQVELQKAFDKYQCKAASIAIMDPQTGQILAMVNYPLFDPNHYADYPKEDWNNRMVNDEFEPGSTFKLITAVGALEEGVVNEDDKFFCENGAYRTQYGRIVTDHEKNGWLTFTQVFGYSSNIGMVKVGAKLGAEKLYKYAKKFGIGDLTGVDMPGESAGKLRPLKDWSGLSMTTIPYGYEVSTTPIQMLAAYAAIANDGVMMRPFVVQRLERADGTVVKEFGPRKIRRVCSHKTAERITNMMKWVVQNGTGTAVSLTSYPIAGKTGTAYKFMNGRYSKYDYVSSFIGFVPADHPKFAIYVSLDDPRGLYWGGYTAGPVFKEVAKRALAYDLVPTENVQTASTTLNGSADRVPSFTGLTQQQAQWIAQTSGLHLKFSGQGERVIAQSLKAGAALASEDRHPCALMLTLGAPVAAATGGLMPDLRGKTKRQALALLAPLGLNVNFKGEGVVEAQYPPAGRSVSGQDECALECDLPLTKAPLVSTGGPS